MTHMLSPRLAEYAKWLVALAQQPANRWEGFDPAASGASAIMLRDQIGFAGLALAALASLQPIDARGEVLDALAATIERMRQRRVWAYWAEPLDQRGLRPDPIEHDNLEFVALLAVLIGWYEYLGGDRRFDEAQPLIWNADWRFSSDHHRLVHVIARQSEESPIGAVACADQRTHPHCMALALWANLLHDAVHGGERTAFNRRWLAYCHGQLPLRGPAMLKRDGLRAWVDVATGRGAWQSDPLIDAWTFALMQPLDPAWVAPCAALIAQRSARLLAKGGVEQAREAAFSLMLATSSGDQALAERLIVWADRTIEPCHDAEGRRFTRGPAGLTALFAWAEAGGFAALGSLAQAHPTALADQPLPGFAGRIADKCASERAAERAE